MACDIIPNEQWKRLRPLLPPQNLKPGRPAKNYRAVVNGILWLMRTGAPWRDLPTEYGPWQMVASRFYRWGRSGVWGNILQTLQQQADAKGQIDWEMQYLDSKLSSGRINTLPARKSKVATKRWVVAKAASVPRCLCGPMAEASLWCSCSLRDSGTS